MPRLLAASLLLMGSLTLIAVAQSGGDGDRGAGSATDSDAVLEEMMQQLEQAPPIPPTQRPASADVLRATDPRILGLAPQRDRPPELLPEGRLIVRRRASLRFLDDPHATALLVFDADDHGSPELPMFLMPCQVTANLEAAGRRELAGDLVVTGQVFVYQGANYLLPMSFAIEPRKGNLQQ